jgi:hypothetical protein
LNNAWRELEKVQPPKLPPDASVLSHPWDSLLGKQVVAPARCESRDGQHGASVSVAGRRLWIDGLPQWPTEIRGGAELLLTGKLTKVADLEVFRYEEGQPFGKGLPVPPGYDLEGARERYVLLDASWEVRK